MGKAIAGHIPFEQLGFQLIGVFDNSPKAVGQRIGKQEVRPYDSIGTFYKEYRPAMAVLCVPKENVEAITDQLYKLGLRSFWNFGHTDIALKHPDTIVENVHMNDSLMILCYKLAAHERSDG